MARTRPQPDANDAVSEQESDEADVELAGCSSARCDDPMGVAAEARGYARAWHVVVAFVATDAAISIQRSAIRSR